eukprot:SM000126S26322  [mRNA]  locus=s126:280339:284845:+ [translate_table: standard]
MQRDRRRTSAPLCRRLAPARDHSCSGWGPWPGPLVLLALACLLTSRTAAPAAAAAAAAENQSGTAVRAHPDGRATDRDVPLPYDGSTVTAVKFQMDASGISEYNGPNHDNVRVDIVGQGPLYWSVSRYNRGDLAPRLMPRHPFAQCSLAVAYSKGHATSDPMDFSAQAWRPSPRKGVLLATVAQNGQEWNDGAPRFYGTVAAVLNSAGYGYSMEDGLFGNGHPNMDITVGKAGEGQEANIDVAAAWFPYSQDLSTGWTGGYISSFPAREGGANGHWHVRGAHSPDLSEDAQSLAVAKNHGIVLKVPGVRSDRDGLIITTSTDPGKENNDVNVVSVRPRKKYATFLFSSLLSGSIRGDGWFVQVREDNTTDPAELADRDQWMFAFLYVPYKAGGLIGGSVDGSHGRRTAGSDYFSIKRLAVGQYELTIHGPGSSGSFKTDRDGMLLLQVKGRKSRHWRFTMHSFLSYNHTSLGTLLVESRQVVIRNGKEDIQLVDSDFYFAWIDFRNPMTPNEGRLSSTLLSRRSQSSALASFFSLLALAAILACIYVGFKYYQNMLSTRGGGMFPLDDYGSAEDLDRVLLGT